VPGNARFSAVQTPHISLTTTITTTTIGLLFNNMYVTLRSSTCSSSTLLILRRTNCITTASGIVTLCKQPYSMQVKSGESALHLHTVRLLTEGDDTRGSGDTIGPPEDEHRAARNVLRIVV